jgi:hypothetical protein
METFDRGNLEANLAEPMTTAEAVGLHQCQECRDGGNCELDCVLSATCSIICKHCDARNWFTGDLPWEKPWTFTCIKCGTIVTKVRTIYQET